MIERENIKPFFLSLGFGKRGKKIECMVLFVCLTLGQCHMWFFFSKNQNISELSSIFCFVTMFQISVRGDEWIWCYYEEFISFFPISVSLSLSHSLKCFSWELFIFNTGKCSRKTNLVILISYAINICWTLQSAAFFFSYLWCVNNIPLE